MRKTQPNYTFTEKVLIKNMTKYEKAINGKQQTAKIDESYTYDFPQAEPILAQDTYECMKYIEDQDNEKDSKENTSK